MSPRGLGAATLAVLGALAGGCRYGFDVAERTGLATGTVYPALSTLERRGLVSSTWESDELAREAGRPRRRYYRVTGAGETALDEARARFRSAGLLEAEATDAAPQES